MDRLISIHAPRVGSDCAGAAFLLCSLQFQSTLPVWGATWNLRRANRKSSISIHAPRVGSDVQGRLFYYAHCNFNPRSPCGERPSRYASVSGITSFQSTLPVWGATAPPASLPSQTVFQSTLPVWGATFSSLKKLFTMSISIHAPRVGSDCAGGISGQVPVDISIHAPRVGSDSKDAQIFLLHLRRKRYYL